MYTTNPGLVPGTPDIKAYNLPVTNQDTQRRNFDGFTKEMEYTLEEMTGLGQDSEGTTDTDSKTHTGYKDTGYTRIYKKY